jgi:hypothetical protein
MNVEVEVMGAEKVANNLRNYAVRLMMSIDSDIFFIGEEAKQRLLLKFSDLFIIGEFYQEQHLYILKIEIEGRELEWIYCPQWNRYFKRKNDQTITGQEMRQLPELAEEINKELERISTELIQKVNQSVIYQQI